MQHFDLSYYQKSADYVKERIGCTPDLAIVMGSALGGFAEHIRNTVVIDYADIPNFPVSTVKYHDGKLICGDVGNKKVLCMAGRFHSYEGYSFEQLSIPMRMFRLLGINTLILTNAAGGVNLSFRPGDIMLISDHIKLTSLSPLTGPNIEAFGERFTDLGDLYSAELRNTAKQCASDIGAAVREGVYMFFAGPQFETPAEIRMARILGADAVGMSTVPEAIAAAHCGMRVLGVSLITNMAAGVIADARLTHEEVARTAQDTEKVFTSFLEKVITEL